MPRLTVSSFTVHAWPRQHFHPPRSRLPLLTFPVAFFLVAASRGRGDSARAFGWLQKTFSIRFFANCSSRFFSLSVSPCHLYLPYVWRICVRADSTLLIRPAVRAVLPLAFLLRCSVCPKVKWIFWKEKKTPSLPRRNLFSAFAYFVGNFRVERSLHLCIPYHSHNDAWSTLTNILKTIQEFSSKVKRIVLRLLCRFLSLS